MTIEQAKEVLENHTQYFVPTEDIQALYIAIKSLENERPIGYWKIINDKYVECSNCNKRSINQLAYAPMYYCPICGASMHIKYSEEVEE